MFLKVFNEIEVCGQKSDERTNGRTNGDIEALADARRALKNMHKPRKNRASQQTLGTSCFFHGVIFLTKIEPGLTLRTTEKVS